MEKKKQNECDCECDYCQGTCGGKDTIGCCNQIFKKTEYQKRILEVKEDIKRAYAEDDPDQADERESYLDGLKEGRKLTLQELKRKESISPPKPEGMGIRNGRII